MKILFITDATYKEPLGILYIAGVLKENGHVCDILAPNIEKNELVNQVKKFSPDIIGYSVITGSQKYYLGINNELKKHLSFFSVFGGPHPTFFPEFINSPGVDSICMGEGEYPLLDLADNLTEGNITKIKNLWIKENGEIHKNPVRPLIEDLDILPFPDRALLEKYKTYDTSRKAFFTGRGCPYNCSYCYNHKLRELYKGKGNYVRHRSIENVLEEINEVDERYGIKHIHFMDDTFILNRNWIKEFLKEYKKRVNIPFICHVRANLINDELVAHLKEAGCITVFMGIESGDEHFRNHYLKRNMSDKQIIDACKILRKHEINVISENMLALPGETIELAFKTLELNQKCKVTYASATVFQPYPRTELTKLAIEMGYFNGDFDQISELFLYDSILKIDRRREFENLQRLFAIGVRFPFLIPVIRHVIKLPIKPLLKPLYMIFGGYVGIVKAKTVDPNLQTLKDFL